jgi:hypothetical protein
LILTFFSETFFFLNNLSPQILYLLIQNQNQQGLKMVAGIKKPGLQVPKGPTPKKDSPSAKKTPPKKRPQTQVGTQERRNELALHERIILQAPHRKGKKKYQTRGRVEIEKAIRQQRKRDKKDEVVVKARAAAAEKLRKSSKATVPRSSYDIAQKILVTSLAAAYMKQHDVGQAEFCKFLNSALPQFKKVTQGTLCKWAVTVAAEWELLNVVVVKQLSAIPEAWKKELVEYSNKGAIFSVNAAHALLAMMAHRDALTLPSRTAAWRLMQELELKLKTIRSDNYKAKLNDEEREAMLRIDWGEVQYLIKRWGIPYELVFNLDETACRLSPLLLKAWVDDDTKTKDVTTVSGLTKSFLTIICGMNAKGELLPSTTHWNGLTEASLPGFERLEQEGKILTRMSGDAAKVRVYLGDSRWACTQSLLEFFTGIEVKRLAYAVTNNKHPEEVKGLVVMDRAPIHVSASFRQQAAKLFPNLLIKYLQPGSTSFTQPCDDARFFGAFKKMFQFAYNLQFFKSFHLKRNDCMRILFPAESQRKMFMQVLISTLENLQVSLLKSMKDANYHPSFEQLLKPQGWTPLKRLQRLTGCLISPTGTAPLTKRKNVCRFCNVTPTQIISHQVGATTVSLIPTFQPFLKKRKISPALLAS